VDNVQFLFGIRRGFLDHLAYFLVLGKEKAFLDC